MASKQKRADGRKKSKGNFKFKRIHAKLIALVVIAILFPIVMNYSEVVLAQSGMTLQNTVNIKAGIKPMLTQMMLSNTLFTAGQISWKDITTMKLGAMLLSKTNNIITVKYGNRTLSFQIMPQTIRLGLESDFGSNGYTGTMIEAGECTLGGVEYRFMLIYNIIYMGGTNSFQVTPLYGYIRNPTIPVTSNSVDKNGLPSFIVIVYQSSTGIFTVTNNVVQYVMVNPSLNKVYLIYNNFPVQGGG